MKQKHLFALEDAITVQQFFECCFYLCSCVVAGMNYNNLSLHQFPFFIDVRDNQTQGSVQIWTLRRTQLLMRDIMGPEAQETPRKAVVQTFGDIRKRYGSFYNILREGVSFAPIPTPEHTPEHKRFVCKLILS